MADPVTACITRALPPKTIVMDGRRLREVRRERGLSQEDLAFEAKVGLSTLARLERQCCAPCRTWTHARLAIALGENPRDLIVQPGDSHHAGHPGTESEGARG